MQEQISIIFQAGRGESDVRSITFKKGQTPEALPAAKLSGYKFVGWYTAENGGVKIDLNGIASLGDGDTLYARYEKLIGTEKAKKRSKSSLRKQRTAIVILAAAVALLIAAYFVVKYIVSIYTFYDVDGTKYLLKIDENNEYALYSTDGDRCPVNSDGYFITANDSQVEVDPAKGTATLYATVDTEEGEVVGTSSRIMLYKQLTYDSSSSMAVADCSRIIQTIKVNNRYGEYGFNRYFELADGSSSCSLLCNDGGYYLSGYVFREFAKTDNGYVTADGIKINLGGTDGNVFTAELPNGTTINFNTTYTNPTTGKTAAKPNVIFKIGERTFYIVSVLSGEEISGYEFREFVVSEGEKKLIAPDYKSFEDKVAAYKLDNCEISLNISTGEYAIVSGDIGFSADGLSGTDIILSDTSDTYGIRTVDSAYKLFRYEEIIPDTDGSYTLSDGINVTLDSKTGRYTAKYGSTEVSLCTVLGDANALNISIKYNSLQYYIKPYYVTGSGTTYVLYDSTGNLINASGSSGNMLAYQLNGLNVTIDSSYGGYSLTSSDGSFTFGCSSAVGDFVITKSEGTPYDQELFASLAVACGYTLSMDKLALDPANIDYAEYGLVPEKRTDENGIEYDYEPATFTVTSISGDSYTLYIGDMIVSEAGYYVRSSVRDAVYILSSSGISETLVNSIEALVTPTLVSPMSLTTYFNVTDFKFIKNIDYDAVAKYIKDKYSVESINDITDDMWEEAIRENSTLVCNFTYIPLEERQGTINSSYSYQVINEYMKGYTANDDNIMKMLESLYGMAYVKVCKLNPSSDGDDNDFDKYDLTQPAYIISFLFPTTDAYGDTVLTENYVEISKQTANGTYYAYSMLYDMIVEIDRSKLAFLEWNDTDWYKATIFDINIAHVQELIVDAPESGKKFDFKLDNSATSQSAYYQIKDGKATRTLDDGTVITFITLGNAGSFTLESDNNLYPLKNLGNVKYIVAADEAKMSAFKAPDSSGVPDVILTETESDDDTGTTTYYYYYIEKKNGVYGFAVTVAMADQSGNVLNSYASSATAAYSTEYFLSTAGDLYLIASDSAAAAQLKNKEGSWSAGSVFYTKDEAYYLVDSKTGAYTKLKGLTQALYFYDDPASVAGIAGIDHSGIKYKTSDGALFLIDSKTGEIGYMYLSDIGSSNLAVYANGKKLDYSIPTVSSTGRSEERTAVGNFRKFFTALLYATIEGETSLSDEEIQALKNLDDSECQMVLTLIAEDPAGNRKDLRYRFYRLPGGGSYLTIEPLEIRDLSESNGTKGNGKFYILSSFVDKLIADAERVCNGELVTDTSKY